VIENRGWRMRVCGDTCDCWPNSQRNADVLEIFNDDQKSFEIIRDVQSAI
jgi:hypothetical protein